MKEKLLEVLKKYYDDTDEYYSRYFYDQEDKEFKMDDDVKKFFDSLEITYKTEYVECFESCGYDCNILSIAWIENGELFLHNVLLECM